MGVEFAGFWPTLRNRVTTFADLRPELVGAVDENYQRLIPLRDPSLADWIADLAIPAFAILMVIIAVYIILGTFMEGFAMMVLTVPIVLPIITTLGYDPIWFGIIMVLVLEMGLISPPVGLNVFVVKGVESHVPLGQIYRGILPFWLAMGVCVMLLVAFPEIALFLPNTMLGR